MKLVYVFASILLAFVVISSFAAGSLTGWAIKLNPPLVQGHQLEGTFTIDPSSSSVGSIPVDSIMRLELNTLTLEYPLEDFISPLYRAKNVKESQEFHPILTAHFIVGDPSVISPNPGSGSSSSCRSGDVNCFSTRDLCALEPSNKNCLGNVPSSPGSSVESASPFEETTYKLILHPLSGLVVFDQFLPAVGVDDTREFTLVFSKDSPASFTLEKGQSYVLKDVSLYGESISPDLISISSDGSRVTVSTDYSEELESISADAEPLEISLSDLHVLIPARGELNVKIFYRNQLLAQSTANFYAFRSAPGELDTRLLTQFPLIPGGPLPEELIAKGCGAYVCNDWGQCSVAPLKELISVERTLSLVQSRVCTLDCGISFTQNKPCQIEKKLVSVVANEPSSSSEDSSLNSKSVSVYDQKEATPIAELELKTVNGNSLLNIILTQSQKALATYCYNGMLDTDKGEEDVDCGGFCKQCNGDPFNYFALVIWVLFGVGLVILFMLLRPFYE